MGRPKKVEVAIARIRDSLRKRRKDGVIDIACRHGTIKKRGDASGKNYLSEPYSWITLHSNHQHVPLNEAGQAIGGAGGWATGKDFSGAKSVRRQKKGGGGKTAPKVPPISQACRDAIEAAEKTIRTQKTESAFCIDKDGNRLFKEGQGKKDQVQFSKEQLAKMKGAHLTHNHPSGTTFSTEDVNLLVYTELASIRATSAKTDYELTRMDGDYPERANFAKDYWQADKDYCRDVLDKEYNQLVSAYNQGTISYSEFSNGVDGLNRKEVERRGEWLRDNASKCGYQYTVTRR